MRFAVIQFPGSNCDFDLLWAIRDVMQAEAEFVWHEESSLAGLMRYSSLEASAMVIISVVGLLLPFLMLCLKLNVWQQRGNLSLVPAMGFKFLSKQGFYQVL